MHKHDGRILNWIEQADAGGLSLTLEQLDSILSMAPSAAQKTCEFAYLQGYRDHKFLTEQIGGKTRH